MKYYKGLPIVQGILSNRSSLKALKCPYCGQTHHYSYSKNNSNPTRRFAHCTDRTLCNYFYIYITNRKEVYGDGSKSNV